MIYHIDKAIYFIDNKAYKVMESNRHLEEFGLMEYHIIDEEFNTLYYSNVMPTYDEVKTAVGLAIGACDNSK